MPKKEKSARYRGVYRVQGKTGVSYGIDYVHPATGQRIQKIVKTASSESEAFDIRCVELADAKRDAKNLTYGIAAKSKPVLFEDTVDAYLDWAKENKKSWETDFHRSKALKEGFKGKLLSDINPFMCEKYKMARAKAIAKKSVNKELSLARQAIDKAIEWGKYDGTNPFDKVARFKVTKGRKPGSLTPEQVQNIMDEIAHPVKRDMVAFDFYAGWRISEIRNLKWEDVDLEAGAAWIVEPKNGQSVKVELSNAALSIIKKQDRKGPYVFCFKNGMPFKTNLHKTITNAAKRAGVDLPPRKAWHILRRTWASMMLQNGCDVETLRVLGNWKDYSMPMWYADAGSPEHKKRILNRMPELGQESKVMEIEEKRVTV
ncbi:integrase family protein [Desulfatibacillum aliphaticivorans]|uniref:Integrase family protein n=1 Tax=Desulfatibacillum aliphaticivorans TaxID=218208 RepID=B8FMY9_DESAL|nr:tyrosine-type recombinase/integrase [Desulfatibacillum aliphaticivorans]ACL05859.1 integrase family protein [Desulfatibacillum aliphaticivorans]